MLAQLATAVRITIVSIVLLGFVYPLAMTLLAQAVFPKQANGDYVRVHGRIVGSDIIGQRWTKPYYFHGRPSAAGKNGYDPMSTGGTNLGPTSRALIAGVRSAVARLRAENPQARGPIPVDLVTSSASGIDPDISPAAAYYQAPRIARERGMSVAAVDALIAREVKARTWGILGNARVNVLALNLALDAVAPRSTALALRRR